MKNPNKLHRGNLLKAILSLLLFSLYTATMQAQQYKELPAYLWLSLQDQTPGLVFVEDKNTNEKVRLDPGCYLQKSLSIDSSIVTLRFCISKEQVINGAYVLTDKDKKIETRIYFENSLADKMELYLNGHLAETVLSSYKDSIMTSKYYSDKMELLADVQIYFTAKDNGKSITKKYQFDGSLHYIDNEITGKLEEFDSDGKLGKLTTTNLNDSNDITTTQYYNGKKKSVIKGASNWPPEYEEQYDADGKLTFRKQRNREKETTEHFINGELMEREQWFLDESKSIVEFYKNGELESKQIIQNRYSLASEITAHYNANGILIKTEKLREKDGIVYKDIYDSKGKLIKTEKLAAKTGIGENEGSKTPSPEIK